MKNENYDKEKKRRRFWPSMIFGVFLFYKCGTDQR
jgi:hypothetical protein